MIGPALIAGVAAALLVAGLGRIVTGRHRRRPPAHRPHRPRGPGPIARTRAGRALAGRLERAAVPVSVEASAAAALAVMLLAGLLALALTGSPLLMPAAAGAVILAGDAALRSADGRRAARAAGQLPPVIRSLSASLAAGLSLRQALLRSARDSPEPLRHELGTAVDELALGARLEAVLEALASRVPARDMRVLVSAILVQRRTGGDLARALSVLADRLEERGRLARELRGATAQARLTAWLVGVLPLAAAVLAEFAAPGMLRQSLAPSPGPLLLAVAGAMYGAGVIWVRRIGRVDA